MPRLGPDRLPKLRCHKRSGQAVVSLSGKDHYLGRFGTPAATERYEELVAQWLSNGRRPLAPAHPAPDLTVCELVVRFWDEHVVQHYRHADGTPTSEQECLRLALRPLRELFGSSPAAEFGPLKLRAVRERMIQAGLARRSINLHVGRIRRLFAWAVEHELVPPSVLQGLRAVLGLRAGRSQARETSPVRPVPEDDVDATLPHLPPRIAALVRLLALTGARIGELLPLRLRDVERSGKVWLYQPAHHKTAHHGHERTVAFGPKAQAIIRPWLSLDPDAPIFSPQASEAERSAARRAERQTPMTPSQSQRRATGRRFRQTYDADAVRRAITRACANAGVPRWTPHQLRHAAATRIRREYGLEAARAMLGHRSSAVTEIYAEADAGKVLEIAAEVG